MGQKIRTTYVLVVSTEFEWSEQVYGGDVKTPQQACDYERNQDKDYQLEAAVSALGMDDAEVTIKTFAEVIESGPAPDAETDKSPTMDVSESLS